MEKSIPSKKEMLNQLQSLIEYPFQDRVVLNKLFSIDVRGALTHYSLLRSSWNVQRKTEGHTMRGVENEYDGKAYLLAKWLAKDPDEAKSFIEESSFDNIPMQVRKNALQRAIFLQVSSSNDGIRKVSFSQVKEPEASPVENQQTVNLAVNSVDHEAIFVQEAPPHHENKSLSDNTKQDAQPSSPCKVLQTLSKETSTEPIKTFDNHTSTDRIQTFDNHTSTDPVQRSVDELVSAAMLLSEAEIQQLVANLFDKETQPEIREEMQMAQGSEESLLRKRKRSSSVEVDKMSTKKQKVQDDKRPEQLKEEEKKERYQLPLYDQVIARPRNLFREGMRFIQARERALLVYATNTATDAFFTYICEMERIEKTRKQLQGQYQSTYVPTECGLRFIEDEKNDQAFLCEMSFDLTKVWIEENQGLAMKFVIPCMLPGHFTLLWYDMELNKYYYGDSLKKGKGTLIKEAKHFIQIFQNYFLEPLYVIRKLKERQAYKAETTLKDTFEDKEGRRAHNQFKIEYLMKESVPQIVDIGTQNDSVSCGFFVAHAMQQLILGFEKIIPLEQQYLAKVTQHYKSSIVLNILPDFSQWWHTLKTEDGRKGKLVFPSSGYAEMKHALSSKDFESLIVGYLYSICEKSEGKWLQVAEVAQQLQGCFIQVSFRLVEGFVRHYVNHNYQVSGYSLKLEYHDGVESVMLTKKTAFNVNKTCMEAIM